MRWLLRIVAPAFPIALATPCSASALAAEAVAIATQQSERHGTMVLGWTAPVAFEATARDGRLTLRFARPFEADLRPTLALSRWIGPAVAGADNRSLDIALRPEVTVLAYPAATSVVVEVFRADETVARPSAHPPGRPPTTALPPAHPRVSQHQDEDAVAQPSEHAPAAPVVRVRAGEHEGYSRLVFDWGSQVEYAVRRDGPLLAITFQAAARFDTRLVDKRNLKFIGGIATERDGDASKAVVQIAPGAGVRELRVGNRIVFDILSPPVRSDVPIANEDPDHAQPKEPAAAAPQGVSEAPAPSPPSLEIRDEADAGEAAAPPPSTPGPTSVPLDGAMATLAPEPEPEQQAAENAAEREPDPPTEFRFDWDRPVAAALFRRGRVAWLIFDAPWPDDMKLPQRWSARPGATVEKVRHPTAAILRIETGPDEHLRLSRDGTTWALHRTDHAQVPSVALAAEAVRRGQASGWVRVPAPQAGNAVTLIDADAGSRLFVIPLGRPGAGIASSQSYPAVRVLASTQGIVLEPHIDEMRVELGADAVLLGAAGAEPATAGSGADGDPRPQVLGDPVLFPPAAHTGDFASERRELEQAAARSFGIARERARLALCAFYVANGFAADCLGVLTLVAEERPAATEERQFRMLQAASRLLMGRMDEARRDLAKLASSSDEEAAMWMHAASFDLEREDSEPALDSLDRWVEILEAYPPALQVALGWRLAEAAIAADRLEAAERLIDQIEQSAGTVHEQAWTAYLHGNLAAKRGDTGSALQAWERAIETPSRMVRVRAEYARLGHRLDLGEITPAEAIEELDRLRSAWRGDRFEFKVLGRLGALQLMTEKPEDGIRTLHDAAARFAHLPEAAMLEQEARERFEQRFLGDGGDHLTPVAAIALYNELKPLIETSPQQRALALRLSEHLIELDMLETAADTLSGLLQPTLPSHERGRLGLKLAEVYLLDGKPEAALDVLERTDAAGIPATLSQARSLRRAQALSSHGEPEQALILLSNTESADAERVRARIFLETARWDALAEALQKLLDEAVEADANDDEREATILALAAALQLAGDDAGLARLDAAFGEVMAESGSAASFALIVGGGQTLRADPAALSAYVAEATAVQDLFGAARGDSGP
jgi:tetratricopeptide (TPR) repeat protein